MSDQPQIGDLVVGRDGHGAVQSGRVVGRPVGGGEWIVDALGVGRTILDDVVLAPVGHPVHSRA